MVASTVIDLFDRKHRLRQGVLNLQLYPALEADLTQQSKTAGLHDNCETLKLINQYMARIDKHEKVAGGNREFWLDKLSREAIQQKLFELYIEEYQN